MVDLSNKDVVMRVLRENGLYADKKFGQNFLIDEEVYNLILAAANLQPGELVVEVGPGLGGLTQRLLAAGQKVLAIELDGRMVNVLKKNLGHHADLEIRHMNALDFEPPAQDYRVVANIPYNITSPLISTFLTSSRPPSSLILLVQKEVAEKICDKKSRSILSLQVELYAQADLIAIVPPHSFFPAPKVQSAIIMMQPYSQVDPNEISDLSAKNGFAPQNLSVEDKKRVLKMAKIAFSNKRKKLSNGLKPFLNDHMKDQMAGIIDLDVRPEELKIEDWKNLVDIIFPI